MPEIGEKNGYMCVFLELSLLAKQSNPNLICRREGEVMPQVPKYVETLLLRRRKLASSLIDVCCELDQYCKRIGVDAADADTCICGHVMIYTEPRTAYRLTKEAIEEKLGIQ